MSSYSKTLLPKLDLTFLYVCFAVFFFYENLNYQFEVMTPNKKERMMKLKKVLCLFVLALLLSFLLYVSFNSPEVIAPNGYHVHNINTGFSYATIQEAIDDNKTLDGHTIHVDAGTYNENVVVNKQLSLTGDGAEVTIISAANLSGNAINITSNNVNISGFKIADATQWYSGGCGVYFDYVSNVSLSNNYITNNTYCGIYLRSSNNNTITNNTICSNYWGIYLEGASFYNVITRNNASLNTYYGIIIWSWSNHNLVANNIFLDNVWEITLGYSDFNVIAYNNVSENSMGIEIQQISNNNTIFHNNIINNDVQAGGGHISESVNIWDDGYPSGGNYWSNYTGIDSHYGVYQNLTGWDGVGDTAHTIGANNTDTYPLMAPISIFDAGMWNGAPCSVDIVSNSTISNFQLNVTQKIISFNVAGETGSGFCRVAVPNIIIRVMWQDIYTVLVNNQPVEFRSWTGTENTYIYFTYEHSTKEVIIVPELSSALILPLLIIFTLIAVVLSKKKNN
jgi:parallel beta-helix repeat protein